MNEQIKILRNELTLMRVNIDDIRYLDVIFKTEYEKDLTTARDILYDCLCRLQKEYL